MKIYLDLDGVCADFLSGYKALTGMHFEHYAYVYGSNNAWKVIRQHGEYVFFAGLNKTPRCDRLFNKITEHTKPIILTNPGNDKDGRVTKGKIAWVHKNLGDDLIVICDAKKEAYAGEDQILIDDKFQNRYRWVEAGGIAFNVHNEKTAESTMASIDLFFHQEKITELLRGE